MVEVANKHFEVLAMIQEDTQMYNKVDSASGTWSRAAVPPGPALRDASGKERIKFAVEQRLGNNVWSDGCFPPDVAQEKAKTIEMAKMQRAAKSPVAQLAKKSALGTSHKFHQHLSSLSFV